MVYSQLIKRWCVSPDGVGHGGIAATIRRTVRQASSHIMYKSPSSKLSISNSFPILKLLLLPGAEVGRWKSYRPLPEKPDGSRSSTTSVSTKLGSGHGTLKMP